jgi:hypothetical protein
MGISLLISFFKTALFVLNIEMLTDVNGYGRKALQLIQDTFFVISCIELSYVAASRKKKNYRSSGLTI